MAGIDKILKDIKFNPDRIPDDLRPSVYKVLKVLYDAKRLDLFSNVLWLFSKPPAKQDVVIPPVEDVYASMEILDDLNDTKIKTVTEADIVAFFEYVPGNKDIVAYVENNHPSLRYYRDINERKKILIKKPTEDVVGGVQCKVCKSTNTISRERQERSADEGTTTRIYCQNCGIQFKL